MTVGFAIAMVALTSGKAEAQSSWGGGCEDDGGVTICISFASGGPTGSQLEFYFIVNSQELPALWVPGSTALFQLCGTDPYTDQWSCGAGYYTEITGYGQYPTATFPLYFESPLYGMHARLFLYGFAGAQAQKWGAGIYWLLGQ